MTTDHFTEREHGMPLIPKGREGRSRMTGRFVADILRPGKRSLSALPERES